MTAVCQSLCILLTFSTSFVVVNAARGSDLPSVEKKIKDDSDLSEFYTMLEASPIAKNNIGYRTVTILAPTNQAFQHYENKNNEKKVSPENLVNYHISTQALTLDQLSIYISSDLGGNPPLWVTKTGTDVWVNNAKIMRHKSNYQANNDKGIRQVLHIIDHVLEPVMPVDSGINMYNPNAYEFLNQSEILDLGRHRVRSFRQRVAQNSKDHIFKVEGHNTFFIPVDEGFEPAPRPDKIDRRVIDGHVIPNHVLFTGPTPQGKDYETLANEHMMKVTISFALQTEGKNSKMYVKSNTIIGDSTHTNGVVLAEIVKANIPVRNGVVHLIDRPLMVIDTTVKQFLEEKKDGPLYRFYQTIINTGGDFLNRVTRSPNLTLFAPSNAAWNETYMEDVLANKEAMREILNLHFVDARLPTNVIIQNNAKELFQVPTSALHKNLYFNVIQTPNSTTVTVEGGGVNATIVQADIAATNGVVHIIDRVLGVPFMTIAEKLRTDPMLNNTYFLGNRTRFNDELTTERGRKYTYFVPRDYAWRKAEVQFPSAHKKLFMPQFSYHVQQVLERHLVVAPKAYTMADLKAISNDTVTLSTVRDTLKIKIKEVDKTGLGEDIDESTQGVVGGGNGFDSIAAPRRGYTIEWRGEMVTVFRPDVHCTNGIIHVIDRVLLTEQDVRVNQAPPTSPSPLLVPLLCLSPFLFSLY